MNKIIFRKGFTAEPVPPEIKKIIVGNSYKENPNIAVSDLAYLKVRHYNFAHETAEGELIVSAKLAREVLEIFSELYDNEYEIEKIRLVDYYDSDDEKSMSDNNSSAFNYRKVANTDTISMHSFGRAIDINPLINPYIVGDKIMPANGVQYSDRNLAFLHKIDHDDICYKIFISHGWKWGGDWCNSKDYQHFYKDVKRPFRAVLRRIKAISGR